MKEMIETSRAFFQRFILPALILMGCLALHADPAEATITSPTGAITVATNNAVTFSAASTDSTGYDVYIVNSYSWTFGDGASGLGASTSHAYAAPGTYTATLVVSYTGKFCKRMDLNGNCTSYTSTTGTASATRTITVLAPPVINSFSASATSVGVGKPVTLNWTTLNATSLSISGVGTVTGTSVVVYPTAPTTYTLTASNAISTTNSSVSVATYTVGVGITPNSTSLLLGGTQSFSASVTPANQGVSWSATGGSLSGTTATTTTFTATASGSFTVKATSLEDPSKNASATVTVATVSVGTPVPVPSSAQTFVGGTVSFNAAVSGAVNTGVTWAVNGGGTISSSGVFTASSQGDWTVTATSQADATKMASTLVHVLPLVVTINPVISTVKIGQTQSFSAAVTGPGTPDQAVTWSVVSFNGGTITSAGLYTPPVASGNYTVKAVSVQDPTCFASATVTVATVAVGTPVPVPSSAQTFVGGTVSFSAAVSGAVNTGVTWAVSGGGTISASGVFSASSQGDWTVTATSQVDATKTASTLVHVLPVTVTINPASPTVQIGQTQLFNATVTGPGAPSQAVTWSVVSSNGGTITSSGLYTAPATSGNYSVMATSAQDPSCIATTPIHVPGWVLKWKKDIVYAGTKEVAEVDTQGTHMTLVDQVGSPRFLVGSSGVLETTQKYLPFGESLADPTSAARFAKGFTNHEQTDPSGLIYMQARFYAPWYGRFLSPDPARDQHFEETQSWNIYSYVQNNPTMSIDPTGMILDSNNKDLMLAYGRRIAPNANMTWSEKGGYQISLKDGAQSSKGFELLSELISSTNTMTLNFNVGEGSAGRIPASGPGDATINVDLSQHNQAYVVDADKVGSDGKRPMFAPGVKLEEMDQTIVVAHELIHGLHAVEGTQDFSPTSNLVQINPMTRESTKKEELNTIGTGGHGNDPKLHGITENAIRKELGNTQHRVSHLGKKEEKK